MFTPRTTNPAHTSRSNSDSFFKTRVQAKLSVGQPGDKYEVEADRTADSVVSKLNEPASQPADQPSFFAPKPLVQTKTPEVQQTAEQEPEIQEKPIAESITPLVQTSLLEEPVQEKGMEEEQTVQKAAEPEQEVQLSLLEEPTADHTVQQKEMPAASSGEAVQMAMTDNASSAQPSFPKPVLQQQPEKIQAKEEGDEEQVQEKAEETTSVVQMDLAQPPAPPEENGGDAQDQGTVQTKLSAGGDDDDQAVQQKGEGGSADGIASQLSASKGGGSPMASGTQEEMNRGFGTDFSNVRIHNDANAVQMNQELGSQAFANGNDVYFNEGKYNPSSSEGKHLLAHELTHTVQQGATPNSASVQKAPAPKGAPQTKPVAPIDISQRLELTDAWSKYLDAQFAEGKSKVEVDVKIGERYSGTIEVSKKNKTLKGEGAKYELAKGSKKHYLDINGWSFLDPLRENGLFPILVLNKFGDEQVTTGFLSLRQGEDKPLLQDAHQFLKKFNENLEKMKFLGIKPLNVVDGFENKFEAGKLIYQINSMSTVVDGFLEAGGGMGITGDAFTFNVKANVDVAGLAQGEFNIARGEDGQLSGSGDISADIANINANIHVEYIDGVVTIQGTGKINSDKFSGEITLLVTDKKRSKELMNAALGVETMEKDADEADKPVLKTMGNQVLAGWGEVTANITPWLAGTAKVGIDNEGHVTIVGEITVPNEVELMEQRGKKVDIFKFEIRAGYGIPLVGQVFLFASIGMFMNAGFGPLVLKNVGFTGTYSTDPDVLQNFSVTGTLGINAFAILGLEAEAGVGVTLLGHDIKAGVNVTAAAGIKAYAEATPTLEYQEQKAPEGGKVGETHLKGHFEAAAQLFLQLSGALFYEIDSPWWSPVPEGREEYPMGEVQYPIGPSMGIGADMDWLVGSSDIPELKFSPVEFDADKFTSDVMADPPPRKMGNAEADEKGEWTDGEKPNDQTDDPNLKDSDGLPENSKKKEDLKKLPDEEKYLRALNEMADLETAKPKPTIAVVKAKAKKVKGKYGLNEITVTDEDDYAEVFVRHVDQDNGDHILEVPVMSEAERMKLLHDAMQDLKTRSEKAADPKDGTMEEAKAKEMLVDWQKAHPVVEETHVVDGGETWDYFIDIGDKTQKEKGKKKKVEAEIAEIDKGDGEIGKVAMFTADGEKHKLWIKVSGAAVDVMVASIQMSVTEKIATWRKGLMAISDKAKAEELLARAESLHLEVLGKAQKANETQHLEETAPSIEHAQTAEIADNAVELAEDKLKSVLGNLFELYGEGVIELDLSLIQVYFTDLTGQKRRIYLEKKSELLYLMLEADNPRTYRAFLDGIDLAAHKNPESAKEARKNAEPILQRIEVLTKEKAPENATEDDRKAFAKNKAIEIDKEAEKLVPFTKILFERNSDLPESSTPAYEQMAGAPDVVSKKMTIELLTSKGVEGSTPTAAKNKVYDTLDQRKNGKKPYYVKGHMLNHNVHGLGIYPNLTPLSIDGNSAHLHNAENTIKIAVSAGSVIKYIVAAEGNHGVKVPTKSEMETAGIPQEKHEVVKEIREMEKFVPQKLVVSASTLREEGTSGKFTVEKELFKNKPILNPVDTNLKNYDLGTGKPKKEEVVLKIDSSDFIAKNTDQDELYIDEIITIMKTKNKNQYDSTETYIKTSGKYNQDDQADLLKVLAALKKLDNVRINPEKD